MTFHPSEAQRLALSTMSVAQITLGIARIQDSIHAVESFDLKAISDTTFVDGSLTFEAKLLQDEIAATLRAVFGQSPAFETYESASRLCSTHWQREPKDPGAQQERILNAYAEGKKRSVSLLRHAIKTLQDEISSREVVPMHRPKIFLVHGRDDGSKETVARFLERLGLEPIILHERVNMGRNILSKFQQEAADATFAVVLMTPDDHGGIAGDTLKPRARQNVIFELGFFIGKLGHDRVAALLKGGVERPSDFDGVIYIPLDNGDSWRTALGRDLKAAGFSIDWNMVMRT